MTKEQELQLLDLGYKISNGYILKYIDSDKEPKQYWSNRPKIFEFQIWGWQIVAHTSKVENFLNDLTVS